MKSAAELFNEALAALDKAGKRSKFNTKLTAITERSGKTLPIESQLNLAEETLRESRVIRKYNGDEHNSLITESYGYVQETTNPFAETDKVTYDFLESRGEMTADQKRQALNQPPAEYSNLTEAQKREYDFARSVGISEVDAMKLTKLVAGRI